MSAQHYISRFLLKEFCIEDQKSMIWRYDLSNNFSKKVNINSVLAQKGKWGQDVEDWLSHLEGKEAAPLLRRIINCDPDRSVCLGDYYRVPFNFMPNNKAIFLRYMAALMTINKLRDRVFDLNEIVHAVLTGGKIIEHKLDGGIASALPEMCARAIWQDKLTREDKQELKNFRRKGIFSELYRYKIAVKFQEKQLELIWQHGHLYCLYSPERQFIVGEGYISPLIGYVTETKKAISGYVFPIAPKVSIFLLFPAPAPDKIVGYFTVKRVNHNAFALAKNDGIRRKTSTAIYGADEELLQETIRSSIGFPEKYFSYPLLGLVNIS